MAVANSAHAPCEEREMSGRERERERERERDRETERQRQRDRETEKPVQQSLGRTLVAGVQRRLEHKEDLS
jgi:hypothetical protein